MCISKHNEQGNTLHRNVTGSADSKFEVFVSSWMNTVMLLRDNVLQTGHPLLTRAFPMPEQPAYSPDLVLFIFFIGLALRDIALQCDGGVDTWWSGESDSPECKSCLCYSLAL